MANTAISGDRSEHNQGKTRGRPPKPDGPLESLSISLPSTMVEQMRDEQNKGDIESLSAVARLAIADDLRRAGKRQALDSERQGRNIAK